MVTVPDECGSAHAELTGASPDGIVTALTAEPGRPLAERRILVTRARAQASAEVEVLPIYRTVLPEETVARLREELGGRVDAVTFISSSTVAHFREALGGAPFPEGAVAACIGPVTARAARAAGYPVAVVAGEDTTAALAAALCAHFTAAAGTPR